MSVSDKAHLKTMIQSRYSRPDGITFSLFRTFIQNLTSTLPIMPLSDITGGDLFESMQLPLEPKTLHATFL